MQLDLWESEVARLPWRGQSPRVLTRGFKALFLRREPQKDERFFADPRQLSLTLVAERAPLILSGAPLLLEPGREDV